MSINLIQTKSGINSNLSDEKGLSASLLLKFSNISFTTCQSNYFHSPLSKSLPVLLYDDKIIPSDQIFQFIKTNVTNIDDSLTVMQKIDISAISSLINYKLYPAFLYVLTYNNYHQKVYSNTILNNLPMHFSSSYFRSRYLNIKAKNMGIKNINHAYSIINDIYRILSIKIGDNLFYFGDNPSSLDALIGGHLCFNFAFASYFNKIEEIFFEYPNLICYVHHLHKLMKIEYDGEEKKIYMEKLFEKQEKYKKYALKFVSISLLFFIGTSYYMCKLNKRNL